MKKVIAILIFLSFVAHARVHAPHKRKLHVTDYCPVLGQNVTITNPPTQQQYLEIKAAALKIKNDHQRADCIGAVNGTLKQFQYSNDYGIWDTYRGYVLIWCCEPHHD